MAKKSGGQPFRHGPAQSAAPSSGRIGGPINKVSSAQGVKNVAGGGSGTNGVPLKGTGLGSMKKPK